MRSTVPVAGTKNASWVSARGGALVLGFEIIDVVTRRTCVRAETQLAFFVPATGTVLRITPGQQEILAPYAGAPVFR